MAAKKTAKPDPVVKNRKEMIALIADKTGIPEVDVGLVIDYVGKELAVSLRAGVDVNLGELGTFKSADGTPTFKASKAFMTRFTGET